MRDGADVPLSIRDRLVLKHIETEMRRGRRPNRPPGSAGTRARGPWPAVAVGLPAAASVFLAVVGLRTSAPSVLLAFAILWPVTLLQACRLVNRWSRPRSQR